MGGSFSRSRISPTSPLEDENKELRDLEQENGELRTALTNAEDARTDLCCDLDILEAENKELRDLVQESLTTLRLMRDETNEAYSKVMSNRTVMKAVCTLWDRLKKYAK